MKKTRLLFTRRGKWDYCGDLWRAPAHSRPSLDALRTRSPAGSCYPLLLRALVASGLRGIRYYPSRRPDYTSKLVEPCCHKCSKPILVVENVPLGTTAL